MNWKLILLLSCAGLTLGVAGLFGVPGTMSFLLWLLVVSICAVLIGWFARTKRFLHGLLAGLIGGGLAGLIPLLFAGTYTANHPEVLEQLPAGIPVRTVLALSIPVAAVIWGVAIGLLSLAAGAVLRRMRAPGTPSAP